MNPIRTKLLVTFVAFVFAVLAATATAFAEEAMRYFAHGGVYLGKSPITPIPTASPIANSVITCSPILKTCIYPTGGQAAAFFAVDGTRNIWVSNQNSNNVAKMSPNGAVIATYAVGSVPAGLLYLNGNIWVANWNDASVTVLNASTGQTVTTIQLPSGARPYQFAVANASVFVTSEVENIFEIDPVKFQVTKSIQTKWFPYQIVAQGGYLWTTILTGQIVRIMPKTGAMKFYTVPGADDITGIAAIGNHLWLLDFTSGNLIDYIPSTNQVVATMPTGVQIGQTVYHAFNKIWVDGLGTNAIMEVNPTTFAVQDAGIPAGYLDQPLGILRLGKALWVADNGPQNLGLTGFVP